MTQTTVATPAILVLGPTSTERKVEEAFASGQFEVTLCAQASYDPSHTNSETQSHSLVIADLTTIDDAGQSSLLSYLESRGEDTPVVLLTDAAHESFVADCLRHGARHTVDIGAGQAGRLPLLAALLIKQAEQIVSARQLTERLLQAEERHLDIFDNTSDLVQCLAPDGSFLYTNKTWRTVMGYSEAEVDSLNLLDILHEDSRVCCQDRFQRLKAGEPLSQINFKFVSKNGETIHLQGDCGSIIRDGEAISTRGIFRDITATVNAENALKVSEARYQDLYENAPDIYTTINPSGTILSINRTGAAILGYDVEELVGESAARVVHPDDLSMVMAHVSERFNSTDEDAGIEYRKIRKNGDTLWVHQKTNLDNSEEDPRLLIIARDISDQKELEQQLSYQATHDALTDLLNRREFEKRLQRSLSTSAGNSEHVLCYLDMDQFKVINDTCGHLAGDELLRQIASLLTGQVRSRDALARLGGDEFAVLMEHCPLDRAVAVAENIRAAVESHQFQWHEKRFSLGVSIGVVPLNGCRELKDVINQADSACYMAKQKGRNRVHLHENDGLHESGRTGDVHWAASLTEALDMDHFVLYAQPVQRCNPTGNAEHRLEVLLRLEEKGELALPGSFMPAAERYNLAPRIDRWVVDRVLHHFEDNPDFIQSVDSISVNLSALSLCDEAFLAFLLKRLDEARLPNNKLWFEVTETAAIANLTQATAFMQAIRNVGCCFSLDDFGSGLSSFAYLKNLPVDMIKIDGAFIRNIDRNEIDFLMVKSICEIGRLMNKKTTAEYVESAAILKVLESIGVDYVQGYHLGKPAPLEQLLDSASHKNVLYFGK